jgi:hypothetical protein
VTSLGYPGGGPDFDHEHDLATGRVRPKGGHEQDYNGENSKFEIRNKLKSSNDGMNKTKARFEFSSSNIRSLFRALSFELRICSWHSMLFFEARFEALQIYRDPGLRAEVRSRKSEVGGQKFAMANPSFGAPGRTPRSRRLTKFEIVVGTVSEKISQE